MTGRTMDDPALRGWAVTAVALGCAICIGGIGGLIGLGGGEFRLPILVGLIGFAARAAVPMNQILSLITLCTALVVRWRGGSLVGVGAFAPAVIALAAGGMTSAFFSARLIAKASDHGLERAIAVLLIAVGLLLTGERLLPAHLPVLVPPSPLWQVPAGVGFGLCIGCAATFLGVAGGEMLIPTLIFAFGAPIRVAGSATLFVSIPTVCMGLWRYARLGLLPRRRVLLAIGLPMGAESLIGAAAGGAFAGSTPAEALKMLLGIILIAAAAKTFWRRAH